MKNGELPVSGLIDDARRMFSGKPALLAGLGMFVPPHLRAKLLSAVHSPDSVDAATAAATAAAATAAAGTTIANASAASATADASATASETAKGESKRKASVLEDGLSRQSGSDASGSSLNKTHVE
eukprot:8371-Heterococcus_DN1.PRE.1